MPEKVKKARGKNGGARPGAGRPRGSRSARTIARQMEEDAFREKVKEHLEPILEAQVANAQGIKYFVVRQKKGGKFTRVTRAMAEARQGLEPDEEVIEVWEKDPSTHAFSELLNRAYGKAKEPEKTVNLKVVPYKWGDE